MAESKEDSMEVLMDRFLNKMWILACLLAGLVSSNALVGCMETDQSVCAQTADVDGDGWTVNGLATDSGDTAVPEGLDCDDSNADVHPGATEQCDGLDNDCDGSIDEDYNADGDAYPICVVGTTPADCDDAVNTTFPGAAETCDGFDNNCDGSIDEGFDADGDGFLTCGVEEDCRDNDDVVYPGAPEVFDGLDNDCDGIVDEGLDEDHDGYTPAAGDCDDLDPNISPAALEICDDQGCPDGIDNNCNMVADEGCRTDCS